MMERWINFPVRVVLKNSDSKLFGLLVDIRNLHDMRFVILANPKNLEVPQYAIPYENIDFITADYDFDKTPSKQPAKKISKKPITDPSNLQVKATEDPIKVLDKIEVEERIRGKKWRDKYPLSDEQAQSPDLNAMDRAFDFEARVAQRPETEPIDIEYSDQAALLRDEKIDSKLMTDEYLNEDNIATDAGEDPLDDLDSGWEDDDLDE